MKVMNVVKTNIGAGWAFRQAKWLHEHGIEIITILPNGKGGFAEKYREAGMNVIQCDISLPLNRPWSFWKRRQEIQKLVNEISPDLIHSHFVSTTIMLRLSLGKQHRIPRIFQIPGPLHLEYWLFRKVDIFTAGNRDVFVGTCKYTSKIYRKEGIPDNRVYMDYYGGSREMDIDLTEDRLHKDYFISNDKILIGMVSLFYKPKYYLMQFRGIKGHEDFIDAIKIVRKSYPDVIGIIVGCSWGTAQNYENKVKAYAEKQCPGGIIFTGYRSDVAKIYHEFRIAVHPSLSENLGGAGESMAYKVPTIATYVGGFPDIVINGETGWLVPKHSPVDIANRVIWNLEHPIDALKMADKGFRFVNELLSIDNTAFKMYEIYQKVDDMFRCEEDK